MEIPDMCWDHRCLTACQKMTWSGRHSYQGVRVMGDPTHVGTTDVSQPVKINTDRMTQLVR